MIPILSNNQPCYLVLQNGVVFSGTNFGFHSNKVGELVFNTSITGYQEIISDPSYYKQIVLFTYPHIGNVGCNADDIESSFHCEGIVVREFSPITDNSRSNQTLQQYLMRHQIPAISGIDTRALTQQLRNQGAVNCCIIATAQSQSDALTTAKQLFDNFAGLENQNLAQAVSTEQSYVFDSQLHPLSHFQAANTQLPKTVAVIDYGVKANILRMLQSRFAKVVVLPAQTEFAAIAAHNPDAIVLSNGPGDPRACHREIACIKQIVASKIPTLGICLGHQLLALAAGAKIVKMKFGHHGANHPIFDLQTKKTFISSQNHGFVVAKDQLPSHLEITHISLFDQTIQGLRIKNKPIMSLQGHPEASPGPQELHDYFDSFSQLVADYA